MVSKQEITIYLKLALVLCYKNIEVCRKIKQYYASSTTLEKNAG